MTQYMNLGGIPYISITVWEITAMKYQNQIIVILSYVLFFFGEVYNFISKSCNRFLMTITKIIHKKTYFLYHIYVFFYIFM